MNPTIFEYWLRNMESFSIEIRRTSEVDKGWWKVYGKISGELRKSTRVDGKFMERFSTNPWMSTSVDGIMLKRFPTNPWMSTSVDGIMLKRFPTNSQYRECKMEKCWKDSLRTPKIVYWKVQSIDSNPFLWIYIWIE